MGKVSLVSRFRVTRTLLHWVGAVLGALIVVHCVAGWILWAIVVPWPLPTAIVVEVLLVVGFIAAITVLGGRQHSIALEELAMLRCPWCGAGIPRTPQPDEVIKCASCRARWSGKGKFWHPNKPDPWEQERLGRGS